MPFIRPLWSAGGTLLEGLVSWWEHEETTNATPRADAHGSNTLTAGANVLSVTQRVVGSYASQGQAANVNDMMYVAAGHGLHGGDRDFTFVTWAYQNALPGNYQNIASVSTGASAANTDWMLRYEGGGDKLLHLYIPNGSGYQDLSASTFGVVPTSTWMFVICEYNSTTKTLGISVDNGTVDTLVGSGTPVTSGGQFALNSWGNVEFGAYTHDAEAFYSRLLTTAEKTALYNSGNGRTYASL